MSGGRAMRRLATSRTSTVFTAMNTPTRSPAPAKAPATFARMLVLAQRRFAANQRSTRISPSNARPWGDLPTAARAWSAAERAVR